MMESDIVILGLDQLRVIYRIWEGHLLLHDFDNNLNSLVMVFGGILKTLVAAEHDLPVSNRPVALLLWAL